LSGGKVPFGFDFGPSDSVVVSEAEGGLTGRATASSYLLNGNPLQPVSPAVPNRQTASCWVVVTGQTAWVVNTVTATVSAYQIGSDGGLTLLNGAAANTGDGTTPIDAIVSGDGQYLYVLESAVGGIAGYRGADRE
jgi:hypothetical protein